MIACLNLKYFYKLIIKNLLRYPTNYFCIFLNQLTDQGKQKWLFVVSLARPAQVRLGLNASRWELRRCWQDLSALLFLFVIIVMGLIRDPTLTRLTGETRLDKLLILGLKTVGVRTVTNWSQHFTASDPSGLTSLTALLNKMD